ncbi:MAG: TonB family protein [Bacteroidetes bacterium]|jgi:protein TonB|nr:TonB family protein [Bacteroidota bacterium]
MKVIFHIIIFLGFSFQLRGQEVIKVKKEPVAKKNSFDEFPEVFTIVDKNAEYPGGMADMYRYMMKNTTLGICGNDFNLRGCVTIFVKFIIDENGKTQDPEILKETGCKDFEQSVVKAILNMPQWSPALFRNKPVKSWFNLPMKIKIQ